MHLNHQPYLIQKTSEMRPRPIKFSWEANFGLLDKSERHDKELLAVVDSFEQWCHFLEGSPHQIIIYSDHKNLTYFQTARVLNRRQTRWAQFLTRFDFKIIFRPGKQQGKADALSRRSYLALRPGDPAFDNQKQTLLGPSKLQVTTIYATPLDSTLLDTIRQQLHSDDFAKDVLAHCGSSRPSSSTLARVISTLLGLQVARWLTLLQESPLRPRRITPTSSVGTLS